MHRECTAHPQFVYSQEHIRGWDREGAYYLYHHRKWILVGVNALEAQRRHNARFPTVIVDSGDDLCAQTLQYPQIVNQIVTRKYSDESAALHYR